MRKRKIAETIGNINPKYVDEANSYTGEMKAVRRPAWMKWGAIAACLAVILSIGVFQSGLFGGGARLATLDNGNKISFVKSDAVIGQLDIAFQVETRDLTEKEIETLFKDLMVTAYAVFNTEDNSIVGIEGKIDDMKLIVSAPDMKLNDTVLQGEENVSDVDGVSVHAGYFNSGENVIYYAAFNLNESAVHIEHAGAKDESEAVKNEIASAIQHLIALGDLDLTLITK